MNKKKLIISVFIYICVSPAFAQDTTYFDANWKITTLSNASYFRLKMRQAGGWQVKDCFISGKPQMEGAYTDESCETSQGKFSYYKEQGNLYHVCHYLDGKLEGEEILYYDNNQIRTTGSYKNGEMDGDWMGYFPSGKVSARARFKRGIQKEGVFFNEDGSINKSVTEFSRGCSYPGGLLALDRFLIRNLRYPDAAVDHSIQGTVIVGFNVTKEGRIEDIQLMNSIDISLDKEALRVIALMPKWEPLIIGGIFCDSFQKQPINFKL